MMNYVITFLALAIVAAIIGFGGIAGTFAEIAKIIALICIGLFVVSLLYNAILGKTPSAF